MRILFLLATTAVAVNARCGTGFIQGTSLSDCYKFVTKGAHWYAAEWRCVSLGGHLASVSDAIDDSFLEEEVPSCCPGYYWLGGSNDDQDGSWEWSDGSQFSYVNWDAHQPTTGSPLCLAASTTSGKWSAQPCYQSRPYVCRVPATDDVCPAPPAICADDAKAESTCKCGYSTCTESQYCHSTSNPQCIDVCVSGGVVSGTSCQCVPYYGGDVGDICVNGQTCNSDGTCSASTTSTRQTTTTRWPPPVCTDDAQAGSRCICGDTICTPNQFCHTRSGLKCFDLCAYGKLISGTPCQCVRSADYADGDGTICVDGQACYEGGFCGVFTTVQPPPSCTDDAQTGSTCTCGNTICTPNQYCHTRSDLKCFDVCTSGSVVSGIACQCVPSVNDGDGTVCFVGQTCNAYGTCGVFSMTSTLPTTQTCSDDAETYIACICGYSTCTAGQYCHTAINPQCLDVCAFGDVISGTACQCVPAYDGGDGNICSDGQGCNTDGTCWALTTSTLSTTTKLMGLPACTSDATVTTVCICGYSTCMAGQYCHTTSNPPCLDVCTSGGVVRGTSCQCVDFYGDDGDICTDTQTCHDDGSCWVSSTSTQSTTTTWKYK